MRRVVIVFVVVIVFIIVIIIMSRHALIINQLQAFCRGSARAVRGQCLGRAFAVASIIGGSAGALRRLIGGTAAGAIRTISGWHGSRKRQSGSADEAARRSSVESLAWARKVWASIFVHVAWGRRLAIAIQTRDETAFWRTGRRFFFL